MSNLEDLWDYDDPGKSEAKFKELLSRESKNQYSYFEILTQIARAQGLQGKFSEANNTLDQVNPENTTVRVRYLLERGRVLNSSGRKSEAKKFFLEAWDLARNSKDLEYFAVDSAHMIAIVEPPDKQYEWNRKALDIADKSSDKKTRRWTGSLYNNIGWTYFDQKQYPRALDAFKEAVRKRIEEDGRPEQIRAAKWCVAKCLRVMNHVNEALQIQRELLIENEKSGQRDGYVYEEMAECLLAFGQNREARNYFALAYNELAKDPLLKENEPSRLERLRRLSFQSSPSDFDYSRYS